MSNDADDFLLGGGIASAKFPTIGTRVTGRVTEKPQVQQQRDINSGELKYWSDGQPMRQLAVTLATDERDPKITDDDGTRRIYVKAQMKNAVADAVRRAGASGLEVGGILTVTYVRDGEASKRGFNPPKEYTAEYTPAAAAELHQPDQGTAPRFENPFPAPAAPAAPAPTFTGGLTAEQLAAAQANPATAALLAQLQQQAPAAAPTAEPPF